MIGRLPRIITVSKFSWVHSLSHCHITNACVQPFLFIPMMTVITSHFFSVFSQCANIKSSFFSHLSSLLRLSFNKLLFLISFWCHIIELLLDASNLCSLMLLSHRCVSESCSKTGGGLDIFVNRWCSPRHMVCNPYVHLLAVELWPYFLQQDLSHAVVFGCEIRALCRSNKHQGQQTQQSEFISISPDLNVVLTSAFTNCLSAYWLSNHRKLDSEICNII